MLTNYSSVALPSPLFVTRELDYVRSIAWNKTGGALLVLHSNLTITDASHTHQTIPIQNDVYCALWLSDHSILLSKRNSPIHLYCTKSNSNIASYIAVDHLEQINAPNSMSLNLDESKIYSGFDSRIQVFDVTRPGNESTVIKTSPTRRSRDGQKGLISAIAFNPDYSGLFSVGSYGNRGSVGLYDVRQDGVLHLLKGGGGVVQTTFSCDGRFLFVASRKSDIIRCWDIRNTGNVLFELDRPGNTNQRLGFSIDCTGRYLATGDTQGNIEIFDIHDPDTPSSRLYHTQTKAHRDVVSCTAFHPSLAMLVSASGQRRYTHDYDGLVRSDGLDDDGLEFDCGLRSWQVNYDSTLFT